MITTFEQLPSIREKHQSERIIFAGGCYDLVHEGHAAGLVMRRSLGDLLVVGVSTDERVKERKGPTRPVRNELARVTLVDALKPVDYALIMPTGVYEGYRPTAQVIMALRPDAFVEAAENAGQWDPQVKSYLESLGTQFLYEESAKQESTTNIIERIIGAHALQESQ